MSPLFLKPIGTIRDLGTGRAWLAEIIGLLICVAALILFLICS